MGSETAAPKLEVAGLLAGVLLGSIGKYGADGGTRTPTGFPPPRPERGVSTNFTTSARIRGKKITHRSRQRQDHVVSLVWLTRDVSCRTGCEKRNSVQRNHDRQMAKNDTSTTDSGGTKLIAQNRRARHDYEIIDTVEAGLALLGTEVKALREGKASLGEGYARLDRGEAFLYSVHIGHCAGGNRFNHDPERTRKLLLHRGELQRLTSQIDEKGLTLVPLRLYFRRGRAKVEVGIARGKRHFDRRHDIAKRDADRAVDRALANQRRDTE